jgi:hypothetical protein
MKLFKSAAVLVVALGLTLNASETKKQEDHGDHGHILVTDERGKKAEMMFTKTLDDNEALDQNVVHAFEKKCQSCHYGYVRNDLAPPIVAVQQVYLRLGEGDIEKAKKRMIAFLKDPKLEKTMMKPAVKLYNVMPNLGFTDKEIEEFTNVILSSKFTMPDWFDKHYQGHGLKKPKEWQEKKKK